MLSVVDTIPLIEAKLTALRTATQNLCDAVLQELDWAYCWYQLEGEPSVEITDWAEARHHLSEYLRQLEYPTSDATRPLLVGALAAGNSVVHLVKRLNYAKDDWVSLRDQLRNEVIPGGADASPELKRRASEHIRQCLKTMGEGRLDLKAVTRQVPLLEGTAFRLIWQHYNATPTERRCIQDVVNELRGLIAENRFSSDEEYGLINAEIVRLGSLNPAQEVAYRLRNTSVIGTRFSAGFTRKAQKGYVNSAYAGNPVFFPSSPGITPVVTPFKRDSVQSKPDRKRVSQDRVTRIYRLSNYYWYLDTPKKKPVASPKRSKNPYASTGFPGLFFWARPSKKKGLTPHIRVLLSNGTVTQKSIDQHGYETAWRMAAELYCEGRDNLDVNAVIAAIPNPSRYKEMLTWTMMRLDGEAKNGEE